MLALGGFNVSKVSWWSLDLLLCEDPRLVLLDSLLLHKVIRRHVLDHLCVYMHAYNMHGVRIHT